jgi:hypothetical protein
MNLNGITIALLNQHEVNRLNREFWLKESERRDKRMSDELLRKRAEKDMRSESARGVPIKLQKTLEQALTDAEGSKNAFQSDFSHKGGCAPRCDALQSLIKEIVDKNSKITPGQLLRELRRVQGAGTISSIEEESDAKADEPRMIHFVEDDETPKRTPISGLKDRLYRAKRKIASR